MFKTLTQRKSARRTAQSSRSTPPWLRTLSPHSDLDPHNPMRRFELRGLLSPEGLRAWTTRRVSLIVGMLTGLWLAGAVIVLLTDRSAGMALYSTIQSIIGLLLVLSLFDKLVLDLVAVLTSLNTISSDLEKGHLQLVALSPVSSKDIIDAKHTAAQIRAWRVTVNVMALRLAVVLLFLLHNTLLPILLFPDDNVLLVLLEGFRSTPAQVVLAMPFTMLTVLVTAGVHVLEPRWRLRALAAGSVSVSTRRRPFTLAILNAIGVVVSIWFMQIVLAAFAAFAAMYWGSVVLAVPPIASIMVLIYVLVIAALIYGAYYSLSSMWLDTAGKRLLRLLRT
jgi:hypothetical protein